MYKMLSRLMAMPLQDIFRMCRARQAVLGIEDKRQGVVERCIKILRLGRKRPKGVFCRHRRREEDSRCDGMPCAIPSDLVAGGLEGMRRRRWRSVGGLVLLLASG